MSQQFIEQRTFTLLRTGHVAAFVFVALMALCTWLFVATGLNGFVYDHYATYQQVVHLVDMVLLPIVVVGHAVIVLYRIDMEDYFEDHPVVLAGLFIVFCLGLWLRFPLEVSLVWSPHLGGYGLSKKDLDGLFWDAGSSAIVSAGVAVWLFFGKGLRTSLITFTRTTTRIER